MPDIVNRPPVMPAIVNRPSVIPAIVNRPSVMPDVVNPPLSFPTSLIGNPWLSPSRPAQKNRMPLSVSQEILSVSSPFPIRKGLFTTHISYMGIANMIKNVTVISTSPVNRVTTKRGDT